MTAVLPATCQIALKEWAGVIHALDRGEQLVLIRKGGLVEASKGFELLSDSFIFYPTFEHQTVNFLRPEFRGAFDEAMAHKPADGSLRLAVAGVAAWSAKSTRADLVQRLRSFHLYNDQFATQRLKWQPDQPLVVTAVRAFRLPAPRVVPMRPAYAGCTSWVTLDEPIALDGAAPVLEARVFEERLAQIKALC